MRKQQLLLQLLLQRQLNRGHHCLPIVMKEHFVLVVD
jgi:hypothetical protein